MLGVPNLLSGATPTYDSQAIPDNTDWQSIVAAFNGNGVIGADGIPSRVAPVVTPSTATTTNSNLTTLTTLTGTQSLTVGSTASLAPSGYVSVTSSGGGTAYIGYNGVSGGNTLLNCFYISGGSGNIAAAATLTQICAVSVALGFVLAQYVPVSVSSQAISIQNSSGTAWQALPASSSDRKDTLVCTTAGVLSIVQGAPCGTAGSTRANSSYSAPPPVKGAWSSATPITLTEIYVPALGQTNANTITAGMLTDKSVPISYPTLQQVNGGIIGGADVTMTSANTWYTGLNPTLGLGSWLLQGSITVTKTSTGTAEVELQVIAGTAVVYFGIIGGASGGEGTTATTGETVTIPFSILAIVTTAGTILVQGRANATGCVMKWKTPTTAVLASGFTGIRIG